MPMKLRIAAIFASALFAAAAICCGQSVSLLRVEVTDLKPAYELGHSINLRAVGEVPSSLHVRVFFDAIANLKRTRPDRDHCIPFYTTILWGTGHPGVIQLDPINTGTLYNRHGNRKPSTVTLVFEKGDDPEVGAFRLKPEAVYAPEGYFHYAIEIHLVPSATQADLNEQISNRVVNQLRDNPPPPVTLTLTSERTTVPPKPPCFTVQRVRDDAPALTDQGVALVATMEPVECGGFPITVRGEPAPTGF